MKKKTLIGDGEMRILFDAVEESVDKKKLHRDGYRLYLWNQWRALWNGFQHATRNNDGTLELTDMEEVVGTREHFEEWLTMLSESRTDYGE